MTTSSPGTLDVFFEGANGSLRHARYTPVGGWSSEQDSGMGILGGQPGAVAQQNGITDVFWRGSVDAHLWHAWLNPSKAWAGPQNLGDDLS